jgi:hypothetical protein
MFNKPSDKEKAINSNSNDASSFFNNVLGIVFMMGTCSLLIKKKNYDELEPILLATYWLNEVPPSDQEKSINSNSNDTSSSLNNVIEVRFKTHYACNLSIKKLL